MVIFILDLKISYHLVRFIIINHLFFLCQLPRVDVLLRKVICLSTFVLAQNNYWQNQIHLKSDELYAKLHNFFLNKFLEGSKEILKKLKGGQ